MKKYTVEQVIKKEDRLRKFASSNNIFNDEDFIFPALLTFGVGGSALTTVLGTGASLAQVAVNPVAIISAAIAAIGASSTARILLSETISDKLYNRISAIYEEMGEDFKHEVNEERKKREKVL